MTLRPRVERLEQRLMLAADPAEGLWQLVDNMPAADSGQTSYLEATEFQAYTLDSISMQSLLAQAPLEFTAAANAPVEITLPRPDGELGRFTIVESPVMEPELGAQFSEIHTFSGQGIDHPQATVRLDVTPAGFHAQVLSPSGSYYVDPYYHLDDSLYASYFRSSVVTPSALAEFAYSLPEPPASDLATNEPSSGEAEGGQEAARSGHQLRTYRMAVAATGEYTTFHGGTVALGQAAIVTAINRVTGIFETELSIRLSLVANNSSLVYTNPATDPYSGAINTFQLTINDWNIDAVIGAANYDIGHLFTQGGGGLAQLSSVGGLNKGRAASGRSVPTGDAFWVQIVAHEVAHQFGAGHTWNGDSGSCSVAQHMPASAMEPGSGSTILAYAGICGNDNLQSSSDPYFHSISFDEIINFVDNTIPAVGTRTATGNTVPTVSAGADFTIPARTPFVLTASGNDGDGDTLTFNWEQRDLGPRQDVNAGDNGQSPLFRSFTPTTDPTRTFPRLTDLVNNTTVIGETLPTTTREMNFRVTARDNRAGGGGVNTDDIVVNVQDTGASFLVTAPSTAVTWAGNSTQAVTWEVAGTTAAPISTANVNILLSTDGGLSYPITILSNTPNDGSQSITVPDVNTTNARLRVEGAGNIFFDISDVDFTINSAAELDFGDAPDPLYPTLLASGGANHVISGPNLGATVDAEPDGQPNATATGDGADEDGVVFTSLLLPGRTATLDVTVTGTTLLNAFLDFNGNGSFADGGEQIFTDRALNAGVNKLAFVVPPSVLPGTTTYARFRVNTAGGISFGGPSGDGEVEDYQVAISAPRPDRLGGIREGQNFHLDTTGNGAWDGAVGGDTFSVFGITPLIGLGKGVVGDWAGDGDDDLGLYHDGRFYLDTTGNGKWDKVSGGDTFRDFGIAALRTTATPVVGDWDGNGTDDLGLYNGGFFYLDTTGNGVWDTVDGGDTFRDFGIAVLRPTAKPVVGDWDGNGTDDLGLYNGGSFYLDTTGNGVWDTAGGGDTFRDFGIASIRPTASPIIGDWNDDGTDDLGLFNDGRSFYLDTTLNGTWDSVAGGDTFQDYNYGPGGAPLIGNWSVPGGVLASRAASDPTNQPSPSPAPSQPESIVSQGIATREVAASQLTAISARQYLFASLGEAPIARGFVPGPTVRSWVFQPGSANSSTDFREDLLDSLAKTILQTTEDAFSAEPFESLSLRFQARVRGA